MLKIQEELLKDTAFYKEAFEEGRAEGEIKGNRAAKLETISLLRRLGLSDETIAQELSLPLTDVQSVPRQNSGASEQ